MSKLIGAKFDNLNTTKQNIYVRKINNEKTKLTQSSLMNAKPCLKHKGRTLGKTYEIKARCY
jgi:hypothetical protein